MPLEDIRIFGQSYIFYTTILMFVVVGLKIIPFPKKVALAIALTMFILTAALCGYVVYLLFYG